MQLPTTETRCPASANIDTLSTLDAMRIINEQDKTIALAVETQLPTIAQAVDTAEACIRGGGRVIYCGCGTSGRLGVLDASECPPTYGVDKNMFVGIIAGGYDALVNSIEGAEDDENACVEDLKELNFNAKDMLVGIGASGRTPYVIGGLKYATSIGAKTACIACSPNSEMERNAQIAIVPVTGPEVVTGSTRMRAGTATKMVLNMISTGTMIRLGKVYGNLMVDVRPTNSKLVDRACRIIVEITGCTYEKAQEALIASGKDVRLAVVMIRDNVDAQQAGRILDANGGRLRTTQPTKDVE